MHAKALMAVIHALWASVVLAESANAGEWFPPLGCVGIAGIGPGLSDKYRDVRALTTYRKLDVKRARLKYLSTNLSQDSEDGTYHKKHYPRRNE